jgi:Sigma-70, region 4
VLPLAEAEALPSEAPGADHIVQRRDEAAAALAAIAQLPDALREPATLFFVHECSHQDIAAFLGLSVPTVNNRLHAARKQLKQRILKMMKDTLRAHALPDDFANRIGRLVEARGGVVEALFDPAAMPDLLGELVVSDEANQRGRRAGTRRRAVADRPIAAWRNCVELRPAHRNASHRPRLPPDRAIARRPVTAGYGQAKLVETGVKVIDVMCPVVAGGSLAIAGSYGVGISVVMEELVRRLSSGRDPVSMFVFLPPPSSEWPPTLTKEYSHAEAFRRGGYSEGTVGSLQTFFFRSEDGPWTLERLAALAPIDAVIHLSRERIKSKIYPGVDVLTSRSRALDENGASAEHARIAERVRQALMALWGRNGFANTDTADVTLARARKLQNFFGQPFFVAEPYNKRPGSHVSLADALDGCRCILDGECDHLPVAAFYFEGSITEIRKRAAAS